MGGAASKSARTLPKRPPPSWAGARTTNASETLNNNIPPATKSIPLASETKVEGKNSLLSPELGPVKVDHHMQPIQPAHDGTRIFQQSSQARKTSNIPMPGRLDAWSLVEFLDARKSIKTSQDLQALAQKYGIDATSLGSLVNSVNSPSVDSSTLKKEVGKEGEEVISIKAVWIEPPSQPEYSGV
ncbi:hypothetical protein ONZ45_g2233 [Pleurotus djamor]|nr:hypothetical protein ONZ45_g2233 [Pleurotus djamor]